MVGVSRDDIDKLHKFSVSECRSKFAVASDKDGTITRAYDAVLLKKPEYADRTSYVIAQERDDRLRVHKPQSRQARREHHGRGEGAEALGR